MNQPDTRVPADPLLNCPSCGLPAEITDRIMLDGAPGPVSAREAGVRPGPLVHAGGRPACAVDARTRQTAATQARWCARTGVHLTRGTPQGWPSTQYPADEKDRSETGGGDS